MSSCPPSPSLGDSSTRNKQMLDPRTTSWNQHVSNSCNKCKGCTCGKHKCEIKAPQMPSTRATTTYQKQYNSKNGKRAESLRQGRINSLKVQTYRPGMIVMKTQYSQEFQDKSKLNQTANPEHHEDNIKSGGPSFNSTTYNNNFVFTKVTPTQAIKNPQCLGLIPGAKIKTLTSYMQTYKWHPEEFKKVNPYKREDNLKTESCFFNKQSSYAAGFVDHSKAKVNDHLNFAPRRVYTATKGIPFQTSYKKDFSYKRADTCPAEML